MTNPEPWYAPYSSPQEYEYHAYMDGAGTPDPGGRRNDMINGCVNAVAAIVAVAVGVGAVAALGIGWWG